MSDELQNNNQLDEPSVLDYVKSLFRFGRGERIRIPDFVEEVQDQSLSPSANGGQADEAILFKPDEPFEFQRVEPVVIEPILDSQVKPDFQEKRPKPLTPFPWRSLLALLFALIGQSRFEPPATSASLGIALYFAAFGLLAWAIYRGEWT